PNMIPKRIGYMQSREALINPFFLYFSLTAPHAPVVPAGEFLRTSDAGAYGDYVQQVDWTVGQILEALDRSGMRENTIVIFTSDNGSPARNGENHSGPPASVIRDYDPQAKSGMTTWRERVP